MYFGRNTNRDNTINTNTQFYTSYSDACLVVLGGWNRNLSLKFQPCTGVDGSGIRQYTTDSNRMVFTSIVPENAVILLDVIERRILPAIDEGRKESVAITVSSGDQKKILNVGYDGEHTFLEVATNLNENNGTSEESVLHHVFNQRSVLSHYDWKTGEAVNEVKEMDFIMFYNFLRMAKDLIPSISHSIRHDKAIREAYTRNHSNSFNGSEQPAQQPNYSAPVSNYNNMGDFLPFS